MYVSEVYLLFTISQAGNATRTLTLIQDSAEKEKSANPPRDLAVTRIKRAIRLKFFARFFLKNVR